MVFDKIIIIILKGFVEIRSQKSPFLKLIPLL
jgi:hypothetical protein